MSTTPNEPAPSLDAICALCGKTFGRHGAIGIHCAVDQACPEEYNWHPTNRFTPAQPDAAVRAKTNQWRKKPVVIEAIQFTQELALAMLIDRAPGPFGLTASGNYHPGDRILYRAWISIKTLEGVMRADIGDWIIKGVKGEPHPCKPDIFEASYEPSVHCVNTLPVVVEALREALSAQEFILGHFPPNTSAKTYAVPREAMTACTRSSKQVRAALAAAKEGGEVVNPPETKEQYIARLPADWFEDSSLGTWFPLTRDRENETLAKLQQAKEDLAVIGDIQAYSIELKAKLEAVRRECHRSAIASEKNSGAHYLANLLLGIINRTDAEEGKA